MQPLYKAPRGTKDILPCDEQIWTTIEATAIDVAQKFGYSRIKPPTFEHTEVFKRAVGQITDIVQKEMFTFKDRGNRSLTLRPEGTAGTVRAVIENGLINSDHLPLKLFYILTCFRNERPQAGRFKEFNQFGIELFGPSSPYSEVEIISMADLFFKKLKIENINLEINSIGCDQCRKDYGTVLVDYYENFIEKLCPTCCDRLKKNSLRVLDCKNEICAKISKNAPKILNSLCYECKNDFSKVCTALKNMNIKYCINPTTVRGLDYYNGTIFEFTADELFSQKTICGGGRYDRLTQIFGARKIPALGFGIGLDRLIMLIKIQKHKILDTKKECTIFIAHANEEGLAMANLIAISLRKLGHTVQTDLMDKSVKAQLKYANKINSLFSCVVGSEEIKTGKIEIKNMKTKKIAIINVENFTSEFSRLNKEYCLNNLKKSIP